MPTLSKKQQSGVAKIKEAGFSLLETLVSVVITLSVLLMGMSLLQQGQTIFSTQRATQSAQAIARKAFNLMAADIRATGCAPETITAGEIPGLLIATVHTIRIVGDRQGNGTTNVAGEDDSNDDVTYSFANNQVTRSAPIDPSYQNTPAVLATNVQSLTFRYFDQAGNELIPPDDGTLNEVKRGQVVRIQISFIVDIIKAGRATSTVTMDCHVALRNRIVDGH